MERRYSTDSGYSVAAYFDLVRQGALDEDDRVELLDGVIVAEPPMDPPHASTVDRAAATLRHAVEGRAAIREDKPLIIGDRSVPEPDIAIVPGSAGDYAERHPTTALLIVEVSHSSLQQDRLSKSRIYAAAAVPEYWIVNLREHCLEVYRTPDIERRVYTNCRVAERGGHIALVAFPDVTVAVDDLLPSPPATRGER